MYVHQHGGSYVHWDRLDLPVMHKAVRELAADMLAEAALDPPKAASIEPMKRDPRECVKCGGEFVPKGPTRKVCPACRSESARRAAARSNQLRLEREAGMEAAA